MKARDEHGLKNANVKGRFLYIDKDRYDHEYIPGFLKYFNILVTTNLLLLCRSQAFFETN